MKRDKITIGSRGSKLALIYAEKVKIELKKEFSNKIEIKKILTTGDENQIDRLSNLGGKGLFSTNIEEKLISNEIDIAVHALKDMPTIETKGLKTNFFLKRNSPNEILISKGNVRFEDLKPNSIIGTSSYRREFQLKQKRPDLNYKLIRGNVDTRIKKLESGEYDAILLSKAGIDALGFREKISQEFSTDELIPCAGQGIIAMQCRDDDHDMKNLLEKINNNESRVLALTEISVLKILEGDCDTPVGVFAKIENGKINLKTELFSVNGDKRYFMSQTDERKLYLNLGKSMGEKLKLESKGSYKK